MSNQNLSNIESQEMLRMRAYLPYRKITGIRESSGEFHVFANPTFAQANNFVRKNPGSVVFRFDL